MRSDYWDSWKGLAIIAVVLIHAADLGGSFEPNSFNWSFVLWVRQVVDFPVALFLALSGYFVRSGRVNLFDFIGSRFARVVVPYLFFSIVFAILKSHGSYSDLLDVRVLFNFFLLGGAIGVGYYVVVFLQFILLTPFLLKIDNNLIHGVLIFSLSLFGLILSYLFRLDNRFELFSNFPLYCIVFIVWYPFYHLGLWVRKLEEEDALRFFSEKRIYVFFVVVAFLGLCGAFWEANYWANVGLYEFGASQIKLTSFLYTIALFFVAFSGRYRLRFLEKSKGLTWLGRRSFFIYLFHMLPMAVFSRVFQMLQLHSYQVFYVIVLVLTVLAATVFVAHVAERYLATRFNRSFLGL